MLLEAVEILEHVVTKDNRESKEKKESVENVVKMGLLVTISLSVVTVERKENLAKLDKMVLLDSKVNKELLVNQDQEDQLALMDYK